LDRSLRDGLRWWVHGRRRTLCHGLAALFLAACSREPAPETKPTAPPSAAAAPEKTDDHSAFVAAVDALAAEALERGPVAGLSIAVFAGGREVLARGYGFADVEARVPATKDTSYPVASVSKPFTAAAILRLADQGRLGLDDPLRRFFPDARPAIGALTLRHLMEHTSGLTVGGPAPRAAAMSVLARGGTGRPQGQDWTYSNYNYSLLGLVIEQASGRDYAGYVRDELAGPLGLNGTAYCEDGTAVPGRGKDYLSGGRTLSVTPYWSEPRFFAAGGLCSTVLDVVRFVAALEAGRVISPAMLAAMRTPARLPSGMEVGYGLGTRLGFTGGKTKFGHTGGGQGNRAVFARYPDDDVTVVVLLNTERANAAVTATDVEDRVERLFFGLPAPGRPAAAPPSAELGTYAGEYQDNHRRVRVQVVGEELVARPGLGHRAQTRLVPQGGEVFADADDPTHAVVFQREGARVRGYTRASNGWFTGLAVRQGP
jgi:D-alanyl-D-alanine carboxypeptidase